MVLVWIKVHGICQAEGILWTLRSKCYPLANMGLKPWWLWGFLGGPGVFLGCPKGVAEPISLPLHRSLPLRDLLWKENGVFASFLWFFGN